VGSNLVDSPLPQAKRSEPDVAEVLMSGVWLRRIVLLSNLAGGAITACGPCLAV
jgi:hypothetical protein